MNEELIATLLQLAITAFTAYQQAAQTPLTPEAFAALLPNPAPLTPPDAV